MSDLKARLAHLDRVLDEAAAPIELEEIQQRAESAPMAAAPRSGRGRPLWSAVAAAMAILVLVGGVGLLASRTHEPTPLVGGQPYLVYHDSTYLGTNVPLIWSGRLQVGEFTEMRFAGVSTGDGAYGTLWLFRRQTADGVREDLVLLEEGSSSTVTDALLLTGNTNGVWLGVSCHGSTQSRPAVLVNEEREALRAWLVADQPWRLVEVNPSTISDAALEDACVTIGTAPPPQDTGSSSSVVDE